MVFLIRPMARATHRKEVLGDIGSFAGFFRFPAHRYRDPVLVAGTDGGGAKGKGASMTGNLGTIGIDLVAMCVNDILVHCAEPLFFLDYYATGKLSAKEGAEVVSGIVEGCRQGGGAAGIRKGTWPVPPVFGALVRAARLPEGEAFRTFNMGIGMVLVVRAADADRALRLLRKAGQPASPSGEEKKRRRSAPQVLLTGGKS